MAAIEDKDETLTLPDLLRFLKIRKDLAYKEVLPSLPSVRIGRRRVFRREDVLRWLAEHARVAVSR